MLAVDHHLRTSARRGREGGVARSLHVVDLRRAGALTRNAIALEAYGAGRRQEAAALWERAIEIDAGFGDAIYNLACVHALAGDLARAKAELLLALSIDPRRYRRLARFDADLARLREDDAIKGELGLR